MSDERIETLKKIRLFFQQQVVGAQQQRAYAQARIVREPIASNRHYYETEVERTTKREGWAKDQVEAMDFALRAVGVDMDAAP